MVTTACYLDERFDQMSAPFDVLPPLDLARLRQEPYPGATRLLGRVFEHSDTTYKFYWFLAILQGVQASNTGEPSILELQYLAREMVVHAWYSSRLFKLWFGHQDKLQKVLDTLGASSGIAGNAPQLVIRKAASDLPDPVFQPLLRYVPFRFLSPWFHRAIAGIRTDSQRHLATQVLSARSLQSTQPAPYAFGSVIGKPTTVVIPDSWADFFRTNTLALRGFAYFWLARYLERRNPGVPGIINKLEAPQERDLSLARRFWTIVRGDIGLRSIYSGTVLNDQFDVDHFLPWSFVTHDLIWNLCPVLRSENLQKSDAVPSLARYLPRLLEQHALALDFIRGKLLGRSSHARSLNMILKQYGDLLRLSGEEVLALPRDRFAEEVTSEFRIQVDLAKRLGFETDWELISLMPIRQI